jgi:hypothetical protein
LPRSLPHLLRLKSRLLLRHRSRLHLLPHRLQLLLLQPLRLLSPPLLLRPRHLRQSLPPRRLHKQLRSLLLLLRL